MDLIGVRYMLMRKVNSDEKQKLISFYKRVCREIGSDHTPYWEVGVYPTYQDLENDVDEGRAYGYFEEDDLLGAAIISRGEDPAYVSHDWAYKADDDRIGIIHLFVMDSSCRGKGQGRVFLNYLLKEMKELDMDVCHLDALGDNIPAIKFYEKCGFETSGETLVYYEDLGDTPVYMFEYDLKNIQ